MPGSDLLAPEAASLLDFERHIWGRPARKDDAIRSRFGVSPAAYYLQLSRLIEQDEAMAYDPLLVQRLRRRIAQRWGDDE